MFNDGKAINPSLDSSAQLPAQPKTSLGKMLFAIALVQMAYWLVFYPVLFKHSTRPDFLDMESTSVARLTAPTAEALKVANFKPVKLPWYDCCNPGYYAARYVFQLKGIPEAGLASLPTAEADNVMVYLNDTLVHVAGRMQLPDNTYHNNYKPVVHFVPANLKVGRNQLDLIAVRNSYQYFDFFPPRIGEYRTTKEAVKARDYQLHDYQTQSMTIGLVLSVLALILVIRSSPRGFALWLFALLLGSTLYTHFFHWSEPWFHGQDRLIYYFTLTLLIPFAWLNFTDTWTGDRQPWLRLVSGLLFVVTWSVVAFQLKFRAATAYDFVSELVNYFGIAFGTATLLRLVWHFWRKRETRHWEVALFALCNTLVIYEFVSQRWWNASSAHVQSSLPFLMIGFAIAFLVRNIHLFRSMNEINAMLSGKLQQREAELAVQYARQSELIKREIVVAERHRIMRDMHDGIGGQLMSLLNASRHHGVSQTELSESLDAIILELRLIIDSLDRAETSISTALSTLRARLEPKLKAAGIQLIWNNQLHADESECGPHIALQVLRIVQEAITNAIKHSGTAQIEIQINRASLASESAAPAICIQVIDAGAGFDSKDHAGHGLRNMQTRASALGASLDIQSRDTGTTVCLTLPMPLMESTSE